MLTFKSVADAIERFVEELRRSLSDNSFVKLTLSNYRGTEQHLQKILIRPIDTKKGRRLLFQYRHAARDVVKNLEPRSAVKEVGALLDSGFRSGHLFTTSTDLQLTVGKKSSHIVSGKPTFTEPPATTHDRKKDRLIDPNAYYLKALGITTDGGEVRAQHRDKWRQINKYLEVLRDLVDKSVAKDTRKLTVVDMGSGKGYLTFAAYDYFANSRGLDVDMTGVEIRDELVELGNQIARAGGFEGLKFVKGEIADFNVGKVDMLIALHACDTATDDAIFKGISASAKIIVAAPCCHKEIRRQMKPPDILKDILKHGSMLEREAETVTDGLRAMLLELSGYSARVFEFIPTEHTPKNNMIVATKATGRRRNRTYIRDRINAIKSFYGITGQRLENLLA